MKIKNALDGVHGLFVGRDEQRGVAREENQHGDQDGDAQAALHDFGFLILPINNRTEATKP